MAQIAQELQATLDYYLKNAALAGLGAGGAMAPDVQKDLQIASQLQA